MDGWATYNGNRWPQDGCFDDVSAVAVAPLPSGTVTIKYVLRLVAPYSRLRAANPDRFPDGVATTDIVAVPVIAYIAARDSNEILAALPPAKWPAATVIAIFLSKRVNDADSRFHLQIDASRSQYLAEYAEQITKKTISVGIIATKTARPIGHDIDP